MTVAASNPDNADFSEQARLGKPVRSSSGVQWDIEVDVLVIGFGAAGAVAALQAQEEGAQVLLIDRFEGGGTTARSGGVVYAGATRFQKQAGFDDDADNMLRYLETEVGNAVHPQTLKRFCEGSAADLEWLIANGVNFSSEAHVEKASFPPEGKYLYYSGNEKALSNAAIARPVPRGHRPVGPGFGGVHLHRGLAGQVARTSIDLRLHCRADELLLDKAGVVIGARIAELDPTHHAEHSRLNAQSNPIAPRPEKVHADARQRIEQMEAEHSRLLTVRARKAVVLATGGYGFNVALLDEFTPSISQADARFHRLATLGNDGSGIEIARAAGGTTKRMDSLYIARHIVPAALTNGLLVNANGERFIAEDAYISLLGDAISRQEAGIAWLIINAKTLRTALRQVMGSGLYLLRYYGIRILPNLLLGGTRRAGKLAKLAHKIGVPPELLETTARQHDEALERGEPDILGKSSEGRQILGDGPYYAINMKFSNRHAVTLLMTLGGLAVDEESGAVLRSDGTPVEGLFAAGNCAAGLHSNGYISGLAIADCVFAGRRAGRAAAHRPG